MSLLTLLIILLLIGLVFGSWGHGRAGIGVYGWSPVGVIVLVLVVLVLTGRL